MPALQDATAFVEHLRTREKPFRVLRGESGPRWDDADNHRASWERDPELYALSALADRVQPAQRARVLFQVLDRSWAGLSGEVRRTLERVAAWLACFELLPGQTGALFFLHDRLVGLEIAPSVSYFEEVWMPLVCFCYGAAALELEDRAPAAPALPEPFPARSLPELRQQLAEARRRLPPVLSGISTSTKELVGGNCARHRRDPWTS